MLFAKASPSGEAVTEGACCGASLRSNPFTGNHGKLAPQPAYGHLPPRGKA